MKQLTIQRFLLVLCLLLTGLSYGQTKTVTGTITDESGSPIPGVNVLVQGTTRGTSADFDGNYSIDVAPSESLVFSYVGFTTKTVAVGTQTQINVSLAEEASALEEVVVLGYAAQTRGDVTGSVASVDVEEATKQPIVSAAEALQGRATGVTVTNNGNPGSTPVVRIRGFGSTNSNDPLYIIDGVQSDDPSILNSINPNDIAQMNVLKDGAAAIYGARASNGVVIITTKSGGYNQAKATISVDAYTGVSTATNLPTLLNAQQHGEMIFQSLRNDGADVQHPQYGSGADPVVPDMLQGVSVPVTVNPNGTDWLNQVFTTAPTSSVSMTLSNGNENGKYLFSAGYLKRDGIMIETGYKRATSRINSEFRLLDSKLKIGEHVNISYSDTRTGGETDNALRSSPLVPVYDDNGDFAGTYTAAAGLSNPTNPVANLIRARDDYRHSFRVFGDVYASYEIIDGLTIKTNLAADIRNYNDRRFLAVNPEHSEARSVNTLYEQDFVRDEWLWNNTLNFQRTFGDHNLNALVGVEALNQHFKGKDIFRNDYLFEDPNYYNLSNGAGAAVVSYAAESLSTLYSIFGTVNYDYAGKYFVTGTLRRDKSSRFVGENKSDVFPSVSAGWVVSKENFFPSDGVVNRLKFKASYGELGNQTLPIAYPQTDLSSLNESNSYYVFNGNSGISVGAALNQVGNPNIRWETSQTTNFGVEADLFDSDLSIGLEFFKIKTDGLISRDNSLISTTAIDAFAPFRNLGAVENTGFDFTIGYNHTTKYGLSYGINANISQYKNEVTDLISAFYSNGASRVGNLTRTQVGQPISSFYGYVVEGIFQSEEEVASAPDQGFGSPADGVGRFRYRNIDGDENIDADDRTFIGSPHPDFTYGMNLNAEYKGFDISAFFQGSQGNDIYNYEKIYTDFPTFFNGNRSVRVLDSWTPTNTGASLPQLSSVITNNEAGPNTYFVEDGSYLRLKNLQVGYNFSKDMLDTLGLSNLRVYLQGTNIFTITDYTGFDPEIRPRLNNDGTPNNLEIGIDDNVYPLAQVYTIGVNLKF